MYSVLLTFHSLFRWLVVISLLIAIFRAYQGWLANKPFTRFDNALRSATVTIAHIQLVLGISLYCISPVVRYFLNYFKVAVHERGTRFFGMEHITMMLIAIVLMTIGSAKSKRKATDQQRFKTLAIWFTIALVIIFASIPWQFSPLTSRPYFRWF
jgi:cytochrome c biogenesis factor